VTVGEGLLLLEGASDLVPGHRSVVARPHAVLAVPLDPGERRPQFRLGQNELAGVLVEQPDAENRQGRDVVGTDVRPMQQAESVGPFWTTSCASFEKSQAVKAPRATSSVRLSMKA
jgi:hypothetical protein